MDAEGTESTTSTPAPITETELRQRVYDSMRHYLDQIDSLETGDWVQEDRAAYMPSPKMIRQRIADLEWLQECGFDDRFIASILQFDCPHVSAVRKMVRRDGIGSTAETLKKFLAVSEYTPKPEREGNKHGD